MNIVAIMKVHVDAIASQQSLQKQNFEIDATWLRTRIPSRESQHFQAILLTS